MTGAWLSYSQKIWTFSLKRDFINNMKEKRNSLHDSDIKISVETVFKKDKGDGVVLLYSKLLCIKF